MTHRRTQYGISLFSFQDIVISVTGILILIVLLLSLELTNSKKNQAVHAASRSEQDIVLERERVKREIDELSRELEKGGAWMKMASANPEGQLDHLIADKSSGIAHLEERIEGLESISQDVGDAEKEATHVLRQIVEVENQSDALKGRLEDLKRQKDIIDSGKATKFEVPQGIQPEEGWICIATGRGLTLRPFLQTTSFTKVPHIEINGQNEKLFDGLVEWISNTLPQPRYILFVIRPSGINFCDEVNFRGLPNGVGMGIELLSEDHVILE
jgi:hypothetical protein